MKLVALFVFVCVAAGDAPYATGTADAVAVPIALIHDSSNAIQRIDAHQFARDNGHSGPSTHAQNHVHNALNAQKDNAAHRCAAFSTKATHRTRTGDLSFTKAPLCQLS